MTFDPAFDTKDEVAGPECLCWDDNVPKPMCRYHGDPNVLPRGRVLPWPSDWPIPEFDRDRRSHRFGRYGSRTS